MLKIKIQKPAKVINFPALDEIQIINHRTIDNTTTFFYNFPLRVDKVQALGASGEYQVSTFFYQKSAKKIEVKTSEVYGQNFFKSIDRQRIENAKDPSLKKRYFLRKFISKSDLNLDVIPFQVEVTSDQAIDQFTVELISIQKNGSNQTIDKIQIDHEACLRKYDLPSKEFRVTTSLVGKDKIFVAAATDDPNVGSFNFSIKRKSQITTSEVAFSSPKNSMLENESIATTMFTVPDNSQVHLIRVNPVSKITNQEIGNYQEVETGEYESDKMIVFYLSSLSNDRLSFRVSSLPSAVKRVFLYRQRLGENTRQFISSSDTRFSSAQVEDIGRISQIDFIYSLDYQDEKGQIKKSATDVFVPALKLDSLATISVARKERSSSNQSQSASSLAFDVSVNYNISTPYDQIVQDVKSLGLENLFAGDIEKLTNNIKPLTRVIVTRISLLSGFESFVGIYQPGEIILSNLENEPAIFRFEVAVKSVPDALENISASQGLLANSSFNLGSITDLTSKLIGNRSKTSGKNFSAKFFSKSSIKNSTLRYGDADDISSLGYYSGRTGIFADFTYTQTVSSKGAALNQKIIENDKGYYLKWYFPRGLKDINYFLIIVDGIEMKSNPAQKPEQIFFLGKNRPKSAVIVPVAMNPGSAEGSSRKGI